ncbi:MAG: hypothetical protein QOI51_1700 [Nocardioidaceae bacterium]|nr:hypothetical protein [Nocardioidaceae bacterium]
MRVRFGPTAGRGLGFRGRPHKGGGLGDEINSDRTPVFWVEARS